MMNVNCEVTSFATMFLLLTMSTYVHTSGQVDGTGARLDYSNSVMASNLPITLTKTTTVYVTDFASAPPSQQTSDQDLMTIAVTNSYGQEVSLSLTSGIDSPTPVGNPVPNALPVASATSFAFPRGWSGRICVGKQNDADASKIEGSFNITTDVDISYVDGYTVPIVCSSDNVPLTGCNIELFEQPDNQCENLVGNFLCLNSARDTPAGPPAAFFKACAGSAYTFPYDDAANAYNTSSRLITCCIGSNCEAPQRQPRQYTI